jgi:AcrR family transcriptional regulator
MSSDTPTRNSSDAATRSEASRVDTSARRWRPGAEGLLRRTPRAPTAVVSEFQHSRILTAALEEAATCGYARTSVTAIVSRAGVSRKTFYELYESRDGCYRAVFEEVVTQIAGVLGPLYVDGEGSWAERVRAALGALLALLESDRDVGAFVLEYMVEGSAGNSASRAWLLVHLRRVLEDGRSQANMRHEISELTAEVMVGGVLAILHARLQAGSTRLMTLVNPLMWMIVLPYLGPTVAAEELQRTPPKRARKREKPSRGPLEGIGMRVTYRTARVLAAIAEGPGRSNVEIGTEVEIVDAGQISKLLGRLEGFGLIENSGAGHAYGAANAWCLTRKGTEVDAAIRRQFTAGAISRSMR